MDSSRVTNEISNWIRERVTSAGCRGVVFGLSGGLDSAVMAGIAMRAVPEASLGVIMPCHSDPVDVEDAMACARTFNLPVIVCDLSDQYDRQLQLMDSLLSSCDAPSMAALAQAEPSRLRLTRANLKPRLRMTVLYYYANLLNLLVAGTTNRSELKVGYFTKHGDGGSDIMPLGGLVKWHVRDVAAYLGVPRRIIEKPPTAGLWTGQTDEGEMGVTYEQLDHYILTGEAPEFVRERVEGLARSAAHKMMRPPIPDIAID